MVVAREAEEGLDKITFLELFRGYSLDGVDFEVDIETTKNIINRAHFSESQLVEARGYFLDASLKYELKILENMKKPKKMGALKAIQDLQRELLGKDNVYNGFLGVATKFMALADYVDDQLPEEMQIFGTYHIRKGEEEAKKIAEEKKLGQKG